MTTIETTAMATMTATSIARTRLRGIVPSLLVELTPMSTSCLPLGPRSGIASV